MAEALMTRNTHVRDVRRSRCASRLLLWMGTIYHELLGALVFEKLQPYYQRAGVPYPHKDKEISLLVCKILIRCNCVAKGGSSWHYILQTFPILASRTQSKTTLDSSSDDIHYAKIVAKGKAYIAVGDIFQVVLLELLKNIPKLSI